MTPRGERAYRGAVSTYRLALASVPLTTTVADGVAHTVVAITEAAQRGAAIVCLPEAAIPGHRWGNPDVEQPTAAAMAEAVAVVAAAARAARIAVIAGVIEPATPRPYVTALVIGPDGSVLGRQRKVQLAPVEDPWYAPGEGRDVFTIGALTFGVVICHEGFRYPETVRAAARRGAQVVFHPYYEGSSTPAPRPTGWRAPGGTYHEHAITCRALENQVFVAACNYALPDQPAATGVVDPDGALVGYLPHGEVGVLVVDVELTRATGGLARRLRPAAG